MDPRTAPTAVGEPPADQFDQEAPADWTPPDERAAPDQGAPDWQAVAFEAMGRAAATELAAARQAKSAEATTHVGMAATALRAKHDQAERDWQTAEAQLHHLEPDQYRANAPAFYAARDQFNRAKGAEIAAFTGRVQQLQFLQQADAAYTDHLQQSYRLSPAEAAEVAQFPANIRDRALGLVLQRRQVAQQGQQAQRGRQQRDQTQRGAQRAPGRGGARGNATLALPGGIEPGSPDHLRLLFAEAGSPL